VLKAAGYVIYLINDKKIKFLLLKHKAGHWGTPKGHIKKIEKKRIGALRELEEETGIKKTDLNHYKGEKFIYDYYVNRRFRKVKKKVTLYLAQVDQSWQDQVIISSEHKRYKWMTVDKAKERNIHLNLVDILVDAEARIKELSKE
jgi:bis(5'-nucleosidyl)-tetraphosphatase